MVQSIRIAPRLATGSRLPACRLFRLLFIVWHVSSALVILEIAKQLPVITTPRL
jgi:hypothetical protein